jgi:hypothetical protein
VPSNFEPNSPCDVSELKIIVNRIGSSMNVSGSITFDNTEWSSDDDATHIVKLDLMKAIADQGWFDADIIVAGYGSWVVMVWDSAGGDYGSIVDLLYSRDKDSSSDANKVMSYNNEGFKRKVDTSTTFTKIKMWYSVVITVKNK